MGLERDWKSVAGLAADISSNLEVARYTSELRSFAL